MVDTKTDDVGALSPNEIKFQALFVYLVIRLCSENLQIQNTSCITQY